MEVGFSRGKREGDQAEMRAGDPQVSSLWLKGGKTVGHGSNRRAGFGPGQALVCDPRPCSIL